MRESLNPVIPPSFRFEEKDHSYWLSNKRIPGVNEILEKAGIKRKYEGDPYYSELGKAAALAIELDLQGKLDESTIDPAVRPRLEAFKAFKSEKGYVPLYCEIALCSESERFAGRIDHVGYLNNRLGLIDTKCVETMKSFETDCQLCGYERLCDAADIWPIEWRAGLQLKGDGTYALWFYDFDATELWGAVMTIYERKQMRVSKDVTCPTTDEKDNNDAGGTVRDASIGGIQLSKTQ